MARKTVVFRNQIYFIRKKHLLKSSVRSNLIWLPAKRRVIGKATSSGYIICYLGIYHRYIKNTYIFYNCMMQELCKNVPNYYLFQRLHPPELLFSENPRKHKRFIYLFSRFNLRSKYV